MTLLRNLPNDPAPTADDLMYLVGDPAGTPVNRKITLASLAAAPAFGTLYAPLSDLAGVVVVNGTTQAAIDDAVALLPATGGKLVLCPGSYVGHLHLTGKTNLSIEAYGATLVEPDETQNVVLLTNCTDVEMSGLYVAHDGATVRNSSGYGVHLTGCTNVHISAVHVGVVAAAGFFITGACDRVTLDGACTATGTLADGFHVTGASTRVTAQGCHATDTGDDAFACVSYQSDLAPCEAVTFQGCTVKRSNGRGIAVIGGDRARVIANDVDQTAFAGIFVNYDATYATYGVTDCVVAGNTVIDPNTYNRTINASGIDVQGNSTTYRVDWVQVVNNIVRNPYYRGINVGATTADAVRNVLVDGNSVIFDSTSGSAGIVAANTTNVRVTNNYIKDARLQGIVIETTVAGAALVAFNVVEDANDSATAGTDAFQIRAAGSDVYGNRVIDSTGNIERDYEFSGNATDAYNWANRTSGVASESLTPPSASRLTRVRAFSEMTAAPTTGTWAQGDLVWNSQPTTRAGWICTTAGTPGTWKPFGAIGGQQAAYTQTYATASRTHDARTAATLTDNTGGTPTTTLEALTSGTVYATDAAAIRNNFADLAAMVNKVIADQVNTAQVVNSLIDDSQVFGFAG